MKDKQVILPLKLTVYEFSPGLVDYLITLRSSIIKYRTCASGCRYYHKSGGSDTCVHTNPVTYLKNEKGV